MAEASVNAQAFTTLYGNGYRRRCEHPKAIVTWFEVSSGVVMLHLRVLVYMIVWYFSGL